MQVIINVIINMKSRMKGDFHVRFCENAGVKFPRVTRLCAIWLTVHWTMK